MPDFRIPGVGDVIVCLYHKDSLVIEYVGPWTGLAAVSINGAGIIV
jgi:hypothetical protein